MMKIENITVSPRINSDKNYVSGVVYSKQDKYNKSISISKNFFKKMHKDILYTILQFTLDGEEILGMFKDFQIHPVSGEIIHFDILRVFPNQEVVINCRLNFSGIPADVVKGEAKMQIKQKRIKILCKIENIICDVFYNLSNLKKGDILRFTNLDVNIENIKLIKNPILVVVR